MAYKLKMIRMIKNNPVLYSSGNKLRKNSAAKDKVWRKISMQLNVPVDVLQKQWRTLRDEYVRQKKLVQQGKINNSKWKWFDEINVFLKERYDKVPKANSKDKDNEHVENSECEVSNDVGSELINNANKMPPMVIVNQEVADSNTFHEASEIQIKTIETQTEPKTEVDLYEIDNQPHSTNRGRNYEIFQHHDTNTPIINGDYDTMDLLFLAHARVVKTFSGRLQAITKLKIAQVIMEQELLHHEELQNR